MKKILLLRSDENFNLFLYDLVHALNDTYIFTYDLNDKYYDYLICELVDVDWCVKKGYKKDRIVSFAYSKSSFSNNASNQLINEIGGYYTFHSYMEEYSKHLHISRKPIILPFCIHADHIKKVSSFDINSIFIVGDLQYDSVHIADKLLEADVIVYSSEDDREFRKIYEALASRIFIIGNYKNHIISDLVSRKLAFGVKADARILHNISHLIEYIDASIDIKFSMCSHMFNESLNHKWETQKDKYIYELDKI